MNSFNCLENEDSDEKIERVLNNFEVINLNEFDDEFDNEFESDMVSDSVTDYLKMVRKISVYTSKENKEAFIKLYDAKEQGKTQLYNKIRSDIVEHNLRLVLNFVLGNGYKKSELGDAIGVGNISLLKSVDKYNETKTHTGCFTTYASTAIKRDIYSYITLSRTTSLSGVKTASTVWDRQKICSLLYTTEDYDNIAKVVGCSKAFVEMIARQSLNSQIAPAQDDNEIEDENTENIEETTENKVMVKQLLDAANLTDKQLDILCMAFGLAPYDFSRPNIEIAAKYKTTQNVIKGIIASTLNQIRNTDICKSIAENRH